MRDRLDPAHTSAPTGGDADRMPVAAQQVPLRGSTDPALRGAMQPPAPSPDPEHVRMPSGRADR